MTSTDTRAEINQTAKAHAWKIVGVDREHVSYIDGPRIALAKYDQTGRLRRAITQRPAPFHQGDPIRTVLEPGYRREQLMAFLRGEPDAARSR